ncbi:hypothetical protein PPSIR1_09081 [Plesiocystis pacifica SIR-1]|uniref:Uncharacterized protein n=1 Tax=Plesiocystis pacifica SIR-1 TaxID=391625 RepID=A6G745_9BACT|nr:hypothetical protein [Plesiocystis pacifica]EDM78321.1 hypothetical protein PPSIR1_09081 [Plesiocystis pacifica SIR-1]
MPMPEPTRRIPSSGRLPRLALLLAALGGAGGCQDPPEEAPVDAPAIETPEEREAMRTEAHREALERVVEDSRSALVAADPVAAWRTGHGPPAIPPLTLARRLEVHELLEPLLRDIQEIDEKHLNAPEVVILRVLRFGLQRLTDELQRHPWTRVDPIEPLVQVAEVLDELRYRLITGDCAEDCQAIPEALAKALPTTREQIEAASVPMAQGAQARAVALAGRARLLAAGVRRSKGEADPLAANFDTLAAAIDAHAGWLGELSAALPKASEHHTWTAKPPPLVPGGVESIERLPPVLGVRALARKVSVSERIDLVPDSSARQLTVHVARWRGIAEQFLAEAKPPSPTPTENGGETGESEGDAPDSPDPIALAQSLLGGDLPTPMTQARCEAALAKLNTGLEGLDIGAPTLDCATYLAFAPETMTEAELVLELLDLAVIEPQRRALWREELAELALIRGRWSEGVHVHLRRIMLLRAVDSLPARALAVVEGRQALCRAQAALWIHAEQGPAEEVAMALGSNCRDWATSDAVRGDWRSSAALAALPSAGPTAPLAERMQGESLADPLGSMAGYGLSLIGDEPAQMVGFDRFFWAPLGQMRTLATPPGMHPDGFILPSEGQPQPAPQGGHAPELQVTVEKFGPGGEPIADPRAP